ncbi:hypothetical protein EUTSA_v10011883mg [Eutrema salsugineum]|uniref:Photosystem II 5 kDa protein, chloroplastic n=2 Tax=Eutrema TaxID=98005 RepID=V4KGM6_EUTSA|nr:photosystem II 5 kDa protein, chloroplastic [Eutrema salsugineum]ESQ30344.1 hypothetical protein EUTSA_v10011883mg [Eutrema salsugineum]BAJ34522.1 unnamed protein product [Eutrema halophilum]
MASMTMTSSFLPAVSKLPTAITGSNRRSLTVVKASTSENTTSLENRKQEQSMKMRRDMVFTAAAAAVCSLAKAAMADEEPKRGTEAAKKKYAPVCVTMPTAKICRN